MPPIAYIIVYLVTLIPQLNLNSRSRNTVAVETSLQNAQIAASVIELFNSRIRNQFLLVQMLLFPLLYYLFQVVYSIIFIIFLNIAKRKGWVKESNDDDIGVDLRSREEIEADSLKMKKKKEAAVSDAEPEQGKENSTFQL